MSVVRRVLLGLPLATAGFAAPALARPPGGLMGRIMAREKIRIGVWLNGGPYGHRTPEGQPAGMEIEVARDIARSLGVLAELVPLGFGERVSAVVLGHVDIACAIIIMTPDRLRRVAFAHSHGQVTTVLATTWQRPIASLSELSGRHVLGRVGVIEGVAAQLPRDIESVVIEDYEEALALLLAGEAAALVMPVSAFRHLALSHPAAQLHALRTLSQVPYAVTLPQGEPDLLRFLNTWVFLREEDGTLATLHEAFLASPRPVSQRL